MKRNLLFMAFVIVLLSALYAPSLAQAPQIPAGPAVKVTLEARLMPLNIGWNLIGHAGRTAPIEIALSSIAGRYDMVYGYDAWDEDNPWRIWQADPAFADFNTLFVLERGRGYWVHMTELGALELP